VAAFVGLALIFVGVVVFRVAAVGGMMRPPAWWASDNMSANITVPFAVGALGFGAAELLSWTFGGAWRSLTFFQAIGIAAIVAAYVLIGRVIKAWSLRVRSGEVAAARVPAAGQVEPLA
jgi:hypothetical protein